MIKRLFDFLFSLIGLLLLGFAFLLIASWIKIDSQGGVFFRQERVGLKGRIFKIHKFRSMYKDSESKGKLTIGSDVRITKPGKFLRKYKIDELPQLIDVLLGKMSLVGPRPEVQEFIELYPIDIRSKVLSVRPGITDMASIEMIDENEILGKYKDVKQAYIDIILPIKQQHYVNYVDNRNILLDIKIIYLTFRKIFSR
jgi:lipopolysaccharide/colanic/teichoic acid biosynthesis glycosyltransferase